MRLTVLHGSLKMHKNKHNKRVKLAPNGRLDRHKAAATYPSRYTE